MEASPLAPPPLLASACSHSPGPLPPVGSTPAGELWGLWLGGKDLQVHACPRMSRSHLPHVHGAPGGSPAGQAGLALRNRPERMERWGNTWGATESVLGDEAILEWRTMSRAWP